MAATDTEVSGRLDTLLTTLVGVELWRALADDPWVLDKLDRVARHTTRAFKLDGYHEDAASDALLLLHRSAVRPRGLEYKPERGTPTQFLHRLIGNSVIEACRSEARKRHKTQPIADGGLLLDERPERYDRLVVDEFLGRLLPWDRAVAELTLQGMTPFDVARKTRQSRWMVYRVLRDVGVVHSRGKRRAA